MKTIWKFPIPLNLFEHPQDRERRFLLAMPKGARIVRVDLQNNAPMIWAEVNPKAAQWARPFVIRATGFVYADEEYIDEKPVVYLGSFVFFGTERVGHLFG